MATEEEVKLYGMWGSPFSHRVQIALKLKGIPYDYIEEDLKNKSSELLRYNTVHKLVPVLVHNGKPLAESQVILEYIDETWPDHPILPKDPYDRAMARFWVKFIEDKCVPPIRRAFWGPMEEREKEVEEVEASLRILEKEIEGKKFFGGESLGLVDIVANVIGFSLGVAQEAAGIKVITKDKYPCLFEWAQEYTNCAIVKESLPPKDALAAYYKSMMQFAQGSK